MQTNFHYIVVFLQGVWNLFIHAASDIEKVTASSCLCRISMHSSTVVQHVSDRAGLNKFQDGLFSGTSKSQQAFVTIFVALLSSSIHAKRITQDHNLIQQLIHNLESASPVLRGKIYLLLAEMCVRSHDVLLLCCESRLIMFIERDSKKVGGKEHSDLLVYVHKCLAMIVRTIVDIQPQIIEGRLPSLHMPDISVFSLFLLPTNSLYTFCQGECGGKSPDNW